jgi:hypothetical protein
MVHSWRILPTADMATLEKLVATIADIEGLGRERVRAIARAVRQAGLITTLGRGPSAARMTETDAANLLIAVNVADTARAVPDMVNRYRRISSRVGITEFGNQFEKLLQAAGTGTIADYVGSLLGREKVPSPLVSKRYKPADYELSIKFRKHIPLVTIYVAAPHGEAPDEVWFLPPPAKALCPRSGSLRGCHHNATHDFRCWPGFT